MPELFKGFKQGTEERVLDKGITIVSGGHDTTPICVANDLTPS